jgi:hypothetical protein
LLGLAVARDGSPLDCSPAWSVVVLRQTWLLLLIVALPGCAVSPVPVATQVQGKPASLVAAVLPTAPVLSTSRQLAHEGGIVFAKPLDAITDPAKLAAAQGLGTELALALRAESTMRNASLLAAGGGNLIAAGAGNAPTGYALLDVGHESAPPRVDGRGYGGSSSGGPTPAEASPGGPAEGANVSGGRGPSGQTDSVASGGRSSRGSSDPSSTSAGSNASVDPKGKGEHPSGPPSLASAAAAWHDLGHDDRLKGEAVHAARDAQLRVKLSGRLSREMAAYTRASEDQVARFADGGKAIASRFTVAGSDGPRVVTSTRSFDTSGTLVQTVETLATAGSGPSLKCERTRTLNPDGSASNTTKVTLGVDADSRVVTWTTLIATDGSVTATGAIERADGTRATLGASGPSEDKLTIRAVDAANGINVSLVTDASLATAAATIEAGSAGTASVDLNVDAEAESAKQP